MNRIDHDARLLKIIEDLDHRPSLLLHSCCAPCSSYCLIQLLDSFDITCFYCNPNITDSEEYEKRLAELIRLAEALNDEYDISIPASEIIPENFNSAESLWDMVQRLQED